MRISILTPSYNSAEYIEAAIQSVLDQGLDDIEHVICDAGSTDGTVEILKRYPHLKWVSEPDRGQSDAMNKAFAMTTGEVIGNLNADDYYLPGAFKAVLPHFEQSERFVMGKVKIIQDGDVEWINDPQTEVREMVQWWNRDAYCRNPVGFFYHRSIQEEVGGFNVDNHNTMDLEFLLGARQCTPFKRIDDVLGVFRFIQGTKTAESQGHGYLEKKFALCRPYLRPYGKAFEDEFETRMRKEVARRKQAEWNALAQAILSDRRLPKINETMAMLKLAPTRTVKLLARQMIKR